MNSIFYTTSLENFPMLTVSITSLILNHAKNKEVLNITIALGFSKEILFTRYEKGYEYLLNLSNKRNVHISFLELSEYPDFCKFCSKVSFKKEKRWPLNAFAWLFMPDFFKNNERVLFLGSDTIINCDINTLLNIDMKGQPIAATTDFKVRQQLKKGEGYIFEIMKNVPFDPEKYFNADVFLLDIAKEKKYKIFDKLKQEHISPSYSYSLPIQDPLVAFFQDKIHFFSQLYNIPEESFISHKDDFEEAEPFIFHYHGYKPSNMVKPFINRSTWWYYALKTPYGEFFKFKAMTIYFDTIHEKVKNLGLIKE